MKKLLINLKDWLNQEENEQFCTNIKDLNIIIFPSLPYMYIYKDTSAILGVQNVDVNSAGAHTGYINLRHMKDFNIKYALINHNENKSSEELIIMQLECCLKNKVTPVICFSTFNKKQFESIKNKIDCLSTKFKVLIAYEPLNVESFESVNKVLREIKLIFNDNAEIVFGGNINEKNIDEIDKKVNCDGYLISRSALNSDKLKTIINFLKVK